MNIVIGIPPNAFRFLLRNSTDRTTTKGKPKYCVYYRKRDRSLGSCTIDVSNLPTFANMCSFKTRKQKDEFIDFFISSLLHQTVESNKINYKFFLGTYDFELRD